ncbi:hypothetical protein GCM10010343_74580 [Streptomyces avidinii]|nr:hypothetical protein GCM10010343_74580 [Streptomyces avidinii]
MRLTARAPDIGRLTGRVPDTPALRPGPPTRGPSPAADMEAARTPADWGTGRSSHGGLGSRSRRGTVERV